MSDQEQDKHEHNGEDLTQGNIRAQLWSLAWPLMLSIFFYTLYNIVDAFWVSKISPEAIAAVSISQIALFVMISLSMGLTVGSGVLMAMHIGAKEKDQAERVLGQSFVLAAVAGLFFTAAALLFRNELLILSGATGDIFQPAYEYFIITAGGSMLSFILMTAIFAFNFQGDTFTLTKLLAISTLVNVVLDPILIFGWIGFPALGVSGAAIATLVSQVVFIGIAWWVLSRPTRSVRFLVKNLSFEFESVKKVLNIGIPASLTQVINPIGIAALMYIISLGFHEEGVIAFSIGSRIEFFAFLPAIGFGFGAMSLIGQSIGAGKLDRAREAFGKGLLYGAGTSAVFGLLCALTAPLIVKIFTTDPLVTTHAISYIWLVALSYGFLSASMVEASAFQAIGKSWPGFWIFFLRFIVISVPLAYIASEVLAWPITGVWAAIIAGNVLSAVVGYIWVARTLRTLTIKDVPVHAPVIS